MDITQLILDDHRDQRQYFAMLEQIDPKDVTSLGHIWQRLANALEVHAKAEEELFYPELLRLGEGAGDKPAPEAETKDAIKDHNEIRDAIAAVAKQKVGTKKWFEAVAKANEANGDHMGEEEREGLTDFRQHASLALRHELAVKFVTFEARHIDGVTPENPSPKDYVREHSA